MTVFNFDGFVKVQYLRYAQLLRICGLRLVNMHVRQVFCILRNRARLDLELFTKPSDRAFLRMHQFYRIYFVGGCPA